MGTEKAQYLFCSYYSLVFNKAQFIWTKPLFLIKKYHGGQRDADFPTL